MPARHSPSSSGIFHRCNSSLNLRGMTNRIRFRSFWGFAAMAVLPLLAIALGPSLMAEDSAAPAPIRHMTDLPGNRFWYLSEPFNPYYPHTNFPRLVTPQWVGEEGVRAVVLLTIDDLRSDRKTLFEEYLRPIFEELKSIEGKAAVTLMANSVAADDPVVQRWLEEGAAIGAHTADHPCPLLQKGDFSAAKATYDRAVDQISDALGPHAPRAYRMPCCDSINAMSPRFFAEIFHAATPDGRFLQADSSIFHVATATDPDIPAEWAAPIQGLPRLARYLPADRGFVNYVENYPYPWVVGWGCWEIPMTLPDDWVAFHFHNQPAAPQALEDMKCALDVAVRKQGVYVLTFHPWGWIRNNQVIELIRHATKTYGRAVRFLTLNDVTAKLNAQLTKSLGLRRENGADQGVRLLDVDGDGMQDAVIANERVRVTRRWDASRGTWRETGFPVPIALAQEDGSVINTGVQFGMFGSPAHPCVLVRTEDWAGLWHFEGTDWTEVPNGLAGLEFPEDGTPVFTARNGIDQGVRLLDLDGDGRSEVVVGNPIRRRVFAWKDDRWQTYPTNLPARTMFVDDRGRDAGLRFTLLDNDNRPDIVFSGPTGCLVALQSSSGDGWNYVLPLKTPGEAGALPPFVRADGTQNGVWIRGTKMILHNEETGGANPNHIRVYELAAPSLSAVSQ
ncbi:polysaccharide deacetylase family protein [Thermopirellula anaerolimosa]